MTDHFVYSGTDGTDWTQSFLTYPTDFYSDVTWGSNSFLAVGFGVAAMSIDGSTWTPTSLRSNISQVIWCGSQYLAVGLSSNSGLVLTSRDGNQQTGRILSDTYRLLSVAWNSRRAVAVGSNGQIARSTDLSNERPWISSATKQNSRFQIKFAPSVGRTYQLQGSTNLAQWESLTNFFANAPSEVTELTDDSALASRKYYRLLVLP